MSNAADPASDQAADQTDRAADGAPSHEPGANELAALVGPFWSAERVCLMLGSISLDEFGQRTASGEVLGRHDIRRRHGLSHQQFREREGATLVIPIVQRFTRALQHLDAWTIAVLLNTPAAELGVMPRHVGRDPATTRSDL